MKKLGFLALLLSVTVASVGCEPAKKPADKKPADKAGEKAPADPAPPADAAKEAPKT